MHIIEREFKKKMRIGILTFHTANNFGCVFQCFGLQEAIKELYPEAEVEIINFRRCPLVTASTENTETALIKRAERFAEFRKEYMNIVGRLVWDPDELESDRYDVCVVGSDQVWNDKLIHGRERAYFLEFTSNRTRRISYAASLGGVADSEDRMRWLLEWLPRMNAVSLREKSALDKIRQKTDMPITVCLDPTMLHDKTYWEQYERKPKKLGDKRYVLMYALGYGWCREYERKAAELAVSVAKANGLEVIHYYFGQLREWMPPESKDCFCEGPRELLWLFHHAEYVICCSFHGTVFSLIYEKPFYTFHVPDNGSRMRDLVDSLGIPERYIDEVIPKEQWKWDIPWGRVNSAIEDKRNESLAYLKREIGVVNE